MPSIESRSKRFVTALISGRKYSNRLCIEIHLLVAAVARAKYRDITSHATVSISSYRPSLKLFPDTSRLCSIVFQRCDESKCVYTILFNLLSIYRVALLFRHYYRRISHVFEEKRELGNRGDWRLIRRLDTFEGALVKTH